MWGECWEIKDKIGGKKIFRGPEILGTFWGNAKKGVEKLFGEMPKKGWKNKKWWEFFGGSYTGGRVWGECWEIKDKIGAKKISGGPEIFGGTFGGNAKKGWKNFLGGVLGEL